MTKLSLDAVAALSFYFQAYFPEGTENLRKLNTALREHDYLGFKTQEAMSGVNVDDYVPTWDDMISYFENLGLSGFVSQYDMAMALSLMENEDFILTEEGVERVSTGEIFLEGELSADDLDLSTKVEAVRMLKSILPKGEVFLLEAWVEKTNYFGSGTSQAMYVNAEERCLLSSKILEAVKTAAGITTPVDPDEVEEKINEHNAFVDDLNEKIHPELCQMIRELAESNALAPENYSTGRK